MTSRSFVSHKATSQLDLQSVVDVSLARKDVNALGTVEAIRNTSGRLEVCCTLGLCPYLIVSSSTILTFNVAYVAYVNEVRASQLAPA